jgi:hypothetical protein
MPMFRSSGRRMIAGERRRGVDMKGLVRKGRSLLLVFAMTSLLIPASARAHNGPVECRPYGPCIQALFDEFTATCFINADGYPVCAAAARVGASAWLSKGAFVFDGGTFRYQVTASAAYDIIFKGDHPTLTLRMPPLSEAYTGSGTWQGDGPASHTRAVRTPLVRGLRGACMRLHATIRVTAEAAAHAFQYPASSVATTVHQHTGSASICAGGGAIGGIVPPIKP